LIVPRPALLAGMAAKGLAKNWSLKIEN